MRYSEVVSERILEYCKEKDISVNKLASLSGVRQSTIDNILKNKSTDPKLSTICKITRGLDISVSEFLNCSKIEEVKNKDLEDN